ncbi:MAG: chemotaxis protein CheW [Candidatus Omnitrophica bacterium]|nr:chemotaxis protein CheW [Candidatus Omnitrophota bacterium]
MKDTETSSLGSGVSEVKQFVCFKLSNEEYGIDIQLIQEVIKCPKITTIPQMPEFCLGVINNRGSIIPVFDLRKQFHLSDRSFTADTRLLVASVDDAVISLVVDKVLDNVKFDMSQVDPAPAVKMNIDREYIQGLGELQGRMIVILNLEKMHACIMDEIVSRR